MSRSLRIEYPDAWYHVMNRGRRSEEIFTDKQDYNTFLQLKKVVCKAYDINMSDLLVSKRGKFNEPRNVAIYLNKAIEI